MDAYPAATRSQKVNNTTMNETPYKTIRSIASEEQVTELAIWQVIRKGKVKSRILNGSVVVSAEEWDAYASTSAGRRYLKERRELGSNYYAEMAKLHE